MQSRQRGASLILMAALAIGGIAAPARADMGIPMLAVIWPGSWVLLIPVIAIEAWVATRMLKLAWWPAIKVAGAANLVTTFVGIPITWAIAFLAEAILDSFMPHFGRTTNWMWHTPYSVFFEAAWIFPQSLHFPSWSVPAACLVLCVPMYVMSAWWEGRIARRMLGTSEDRAAIRWGWRANLASYALIVLLLLFGIAYSIIKGTTMYG